MVKNCIRCQSIDPAPNIHDTGKIGTSKNGTRLGINITHYHGGAYLSMIDCGNGPVFRSEVFQTMLKKMEDKKLLQGSL